MGLITVFTKKDCPSCQKVMALASELVEHVNQHVVSQGGVPELKIQCIEAIGPMASLCVRLTRSVFVPHVFFNDEYIGNGSTFCDMFDQDRKRSPMRKPVSLVQIQGSSTQMEGIGSLDISSPSGTDLAASCTSSSLKSSANRDTILRSCCGGRLVEKLVSLALSPTPMFPPPADARIIKLTDVAACSSQPTIPQIQNIAAMGFRSVVNLTPTNSRTFLQEEGDILRQLGTSYVHIPFEGESVSAETRARVFDVLHSTQPPILVHDASGDLSMFVVLYDAVRSSKPPLNGNNNEDILSTVIQVGRDLNCDLAPYKFLADM